jgi:predicted nucleic acid-binding protein
LPEAKTYCADASPLIGLARIDRLDLLQTLDAPIRVTQQVWQEVVASPERPGAQRLLLAEEAGAIVVVQEGDPDKYPMLDPGEASTISAARAAGGAIIVDERRARRLLEGDATLRSRVVYLTTAALLVLAKRRGAVALVRPLLDQLRGESLRLSPEVYEGTLQAAGEWEE